MRWLSLAGRALTAPLVLALLPLSAVHAQDKAEDVKFSTIDEVELHGKYYPSSLGKKAPTVLMLHKIGANSQIDGWGNLAEALQKTGCAVLTFDFRGHGNSTKVDPMVFWNRQVNASNFAFLQPGTPAAALAKKDTISIKDFKPGYYPVLANDIAAAKFYLDRRNDAGECNSGNLILLGAEDGATLGLMWLASEWHRYQAIPNPNPLLPPKLNAKSEGKDVGCAIWLSISPTLGNKTAPIQQWMKTAGVDNKVPMAFVYGAESTADTEHAARYLDYLKPDKSKPFTSKAGIKTQLTGHKLLNSKLDTQKHLVAYVEKFMAENKANDWDKRESDSNTYYWAFNPNLPKLWILAKSDKAKVLNPLPVTSLLP
jgi:pimeloyl-ACP methyl ester carboxylesterase